MPALPPLSDDAEALRLRACTRKKVHLTRQLARLALAHLRRKSDVPVTVYRCVFCGYWHCGREIGPVSPQRDMISALWQMRVAMYKEEIPADFS